MNNKKLKFSLIMGTVGRTEEVKRFLEYLNNQTYRDFELIVIDQNSDDRLIPILESYKNQFSILHLRSERGLSRARNVGLKYSSGDIVAFPDDDCWYPPNLLEQILNLFEEKPKAQGIVVRSVDQNGTPSTVKGSDKAQSVDLFNALWLAVSFAIFLRKTVIYEVGLFDETLGVGAGTPWGAGEETDYLLRACKSGFYLYYNPGLIVYHPQPVKQYNEKAIIRAYSYGRGIGRVLRKHRYPLWFVSYSFLRTFAGTILAFISCHFGLARFRWASLRGRIQGWLDR